MSENTATRNQLQLHHNPVFDVSLNVNGGSKYIDDDGRPKRTGTVWTASSHIITAVIGSGVLSLAWAIAQLGWIAGPAAMAIFSFITYYTSTLLASCYRDPITGKRNYSYSDAVQSNLGEFQVKMCGFVQQLNLFGITIGYTVAASISMMAIKRSNCFHNGGGKDPCHINYNPYMIAFGTSEIILSQIPNFDKLSWLSVVAAVMSFTYSGIGLALGIAKVAENEKINGSRTGISLGIVTPAQKMWRTFQALGNIAFAYSYSIILIEIQDTVKSPPSETKTMKKATRLSLTVTSIFYILCGCMGYAAFGDLAPGNLLTGKGFSNPFWLIDIANAAIVIHLVGAYQVFAQPIFALVEKTATKNFPNSQFVTKDIKILIPGFSYYTLNLFRLVWRTIFVILTTVISMILPFFNNIVGFLGALGFWPLTVYFPVEMYIAQKKIPMWSTRWMCLQTLSLCVLIIALSAAAGSVTGVIDSFKVYRPFKTSN
ncbi:amino acid permease 3-like [Pyrus ussuriensis x Pyrus communis]|uniref:Amino acid permease 3-like n=1 Tax=Pyrus ussuriensis x Pyrus communis TaxID=2448454 RepID=A0A5N5G9P2_9ROSA|nr:amino acid permease 3-like [Pyrus ussuriensis x Pyrus communis]